MDQQASHMRCNDFTVLRIAVLAVLALPFSAALLFMLIALAVALKV